VTEYGFSKEAREVEDKLESHQEIVDELRGSREYQEALLEQGWHKENTGISVQSRGYWKTQREEAVDQHLFDYLLREIMEAELVFWKHHQGYDSDTKFIEDVQDGDVGMASEENIVETYTWLTEELDAPETLESRQQTIGDIE